MQTSPGQILLGAVLGAALGLAGGWLLFDELGAPGDGAGPDVFEPASSRVEAADRSRPADLAVPREVDDRRAAPAATRAPSAEVDPARVDELVAASAPGANERPSGSGAIWGNVTVADGAGLSGVVLRASLRERSRGTRSPSEVGPAPPPLSDLDGVVREAVARYEERRARTFEAVSDASGAYRFEGLPEGSWNVEAFKRDYVVWNRDLRGGDVPLGTQLDFDALPVLALPVDVVMPDGTRAEEAVLTSQSLGSGSSRPTTYAWTPAEPELRLTPGRYELSAEAGAFASERNREAYALRSEPQTVELEPGVAPPALRFELGARSGIRGRVTLARDGVTGGTPSVLLRPLGPTEAVDLELLAESDRRARLGGDGNYAFLDLEPGRYALGVARAYGDRVCVHTVVEVGATIVECDLDVPPLDPARYLAVRVLGSGGEPLENVRFQFRYSHGGGSNGTTARTMRDEQRRYLILIPDFGRRAYFEPESGDGFELTVSHEDYGAREVELTPGQTELTISFAAPARLEVVVAGYAGCGYEGRISVGLRAGDLGHSFGFGDQGRPSAAGTYVFEAVDPGSYELVLVLEDRSSRIRYGGGHTIVTRPVELVSGSNAARIAIPPLYDLVVRHPEAADGTELQISSADPRGFGERAVFTDGVARAGDLPAGRYVLRTWSPRARMEVDVPCGEVRFEAQVVNALRVTIGDDAGSLFEAGLRDGDLILGIDGVEFAKESDFSALYGRSRGRLRLLRGGRPVELDVVGLTWRDRASMGGHLEATSR